MKICTYNVGGWTDGTRSGLLPEELPERIAGWESFLSDLDPDFLLCEEASPFLDAAGTLPAAETLFGSRFPFLARPRSGRRLTDAVLLCGKYPIGHLTVREFSSGSGRPFVTFDTEAEGKKRTFAVVHLSIEANSEGIRQKDLAELAGLLARGEADVITGDFNTFSIREFDVFRPCAALANHGDRGDFETWPHTAGKWNRCIDNIIVRNGLPLGAVRLGTAVLSDHMALAAEVGN